MTFPSTFTAFTYPQPTNRLNSPSHSSVHAQVASALGQVETIIGRSGDNSVLGTLIGDLRSPGSGGGGHVQTANKGGTGQTSFAKGDLLVATSSSAIAKLAVGANNQVIIADSNQAAGIKWGAPTAMNVQSFLATGFWGKPSNIGTDSRVFIEMWGGGASGAKDSTGANEAGGGGGGAYVSGWFNASALSASELVVVGAGGASVTGNASGNPGTNTVFGTTASILVAYAGGAPTQGNATGAGGGGGGLNGIGSDAAGATGGNAGNPGSVFGGQGGGDGAAGGFGVYSGGGGGSGQNGGGTLYGGGGGGGSKQSVVGTGGTSKFGGAGGSGGTNSNNGSAGTVPGGGGGACLGTGSSGAGANGKVIVTTLI